MRFDGTNFQMFVDNNLLIALPAVGTPFGTAFQAKKITGSFGSIIAN
jgi:hypothetical protein